MKSRLNNLRTSRARRHLVAVAILGSLATACGGTGEADKPSCVFCSDMPNLRGAIANQNGSQAQMQGWVLAAFERDTGVARVAEIDAAGLYELSHVRTEQPQTLVLLSPDYIVQSVLSIPGVADKTIRQFVKFTSPTVPKLIQKGPIFNFQEYVGLDVSRDVASDADGDGIPDGWTSLSGLSLTAQSSTVDIDLDGTPNESDPDIDGDGIINWIDPDDNGNGILDVFDGDANGDLENDTAPGQFDTDQYFKLGVEYIAVQFAMVPKDNGSGYETTLKFVTKVRNDVTPIAVQVRGAPSLLDGAVFLQKDDLGNDTRVQFTRQLGDDGISEDGIADDRIFGKKVILDGAKAPRAHEMIFFQLAFGTPEAPWFMEFPFAFPALKPTAISASYESTLNTVLLVGKPFKDIVDFIWTINLYDEDNQVVWTSKSIPGTTRQFGLPDNVMQVGKKYKFAVVAQTIDKVPALPAYTIQTPKYDIR